jgi:hypothetical protein
VSSRPAKGRPIVMLQQARSFDSTASYCSERAKRPGAAAPLYSRRHRSTRGVAVKQRALLVRDSLALEQAEAAQASVEVEPARRTRGRCSMRRREQPEQGDNDVREQGLAARGGHGLHYCQRDGTCLPAARSSSDCPVRVQAEAARCESEAHATAGLSLKPRTGQSSSAAARAAELETPPASTATATRARAPGRRAARCVPKR